jgi:hypothetical protein
VESAPSIVALLDAESAVPIREETGVEDGRAIVDPAQATRPARIASETERIWLRSWKEVEEGKSTL